MLYSWPNASSYLISKYLWDPSHLVLNQWMGLLGCLLQMNWLSLRINMLKFKNLEKLLNILEKYIDCTHINIGKTERCQHVIDWTWKHSNFNRLICSKSPRTLQWTQIKHGPHIEKSCITLLNTYCLISGLSGIYQSDAHKTKSLAQLFEHLTIISQGPNKQIMGIE